jgi:hypothetical protein
MKTQTNIKHYINVCARMIETRHKEIKTLTFLSSKEIRRSLPREKS